MTITRWAAFAAVTAILTQTIPAQELRLDAEDFRVGEVSRIQVTNGSPGWLNLVLLDLEIGDFTLGGERILLGLTSSLLVVDRGIFPTSGERSLYLSIPDDPAMAGVEVFLQSVSLVRRPLELQVSNRLDRRIGSQGSAEAIIEVPGNAMRLAPYTAMFSGVASKAGAGEIVHWEWDFGDLGSADPATSVGMLASHRFDAPGNYEVRLTVVDSQGGLGTSTMMLRVDPFAGETYYVSSTGGSDTNDGLDPARPFRTLEHALDAAEGAPFAPNRLLLKRGDSWIQNEARTLSVPGPMVLDAYADGDRPVIEFTQPESSSEDAHLGLGSGGEWGESRIVNNLHIRFAGPPLTSRYIVSSARSGNVLRNCRVENGGIKTSVSEATPSYFITVEDCEVSGGERMGWYVQFSDWVLGRGTVFRGHGSNSILDHQLYLNSVMYALHMNCTFDGADSRCNFGTKQHAVVHGVLRDCVIRNNRNGSAIGTNYSDTHQPPSSNYVVEGCTYDNNGRDNQSSGPYTTRIGLVTIRNCVIRGTPIDPDYGIGSVNLNETDPNDPRGEVRILNNTFYCNEMVDLHISSKADLARIEVKNNLFYRDSRDGENRQFFQIGGDPTLISDHNGFFWVGKTKADDTFSQGGNFVDTSFLEWQALGHDQHSFYGDPHFVDPVAGEFRLLPESPAVDTGVVLNSIVEDKDHVRRPLNGRHDMGCFEGPPD